MLDGYKRIGIKNQAQHQGLEPGGRCFEHLKAGKHSKNRFSDTNRVLAKKNVEEAAMECVVLDHAKATRGQLAVRS
jgi:hypothetical protein